MELKALIFDVDGTLAETEEGHRLAFNAAFETFGFEWQWSPSVYQGLLQVTGGKERMRHFVGTEFPDQVDRFEQHIIELHQFKQERYAEIIKGGEIQLRPGIKRLILEAREANLKLGIATTSTMLSIKTLTTSLMDKDAFDWFPSKGCAETVPSRKPDPEVYKYVLRELEVAPEESIAFEDSHIGLTAARAAQLATVVCPSRYLPGESTDGAMVVLSDLGEPDSPSTHHSGLPLERTHVTLAELRSWLNQVQD